MPAASAILPGRFSPRFARLFTWYTRRLLARRFHAVRLLAGDAAAFSTLAGRAAPGIVVMNHASWWDPLVAVLLSSRFLPGRSACAPMDVAQLRRFGFFRRLGLFGIDPDDPQGASALVEYVVDRYRQAPTETLWITPQGRFADVREPIRIRAGAALVAARTPGVEVVAVAVEYAFWQDARPEIFLSARPVHADLEGITDVRRAAVAWQRAMQEALSGAAARLARSVIDRREEAFSTLAGGGTTRVNPIYDLWRRLRGAHGAIETRESRR